MAEITQVAVRFSESVKKTTKNNNSSSTKEKRKKLFLFTKDTNFQGRYGPRKIPGPKLRVVEIETQFFLRRNSSLHVCAHEREGVFVCQWETVGLHVLRGPEDVAPRRQGLSRWSRRIKALSKSGDMQLSRACISFATIAELASHMVCSTPFESNTLEF